MSRVEGGAQLHCRRDSGKAGVRRRKSEESAVSRVGWVEQTSKTYFLRERKNICKYDAVPATCVAGGSPCRW